MINSSISFLQSLFLLQQQVYSSLYYSFLPSFLPSFLMLDLCHVCMILEQWKVESEVRAHHKYTSWDNISTLKFPTQPSKDNGTHI